MTIRTIETHEFHPKSKPLCVFFGWGGGSATLNVLRFTQKPLDDLQLSLLDYQVAFHCGCELSQVLSTEYHPPMDVSMRRVSAQYVSASSKLRMEQPDRSRVGVIGTYPKVDTGSPPTLPSVLKIRSDRPLTVEETRQVAHAVTCNHTMSITQGEQG